MSKISYRTNFNAALSDSVKSISPDDQYLYSYDRVTSSNFVCRISLPSGTPTEWFQVSYTQVTNGVLVDGNGYLYVGCIAPTVSIRFMKVNLTGLARVWERTTTCSPNWDLYYKAQFAIVGSGYLKSKYFISVNHIMKMQSLFCFNIFTAVFILINLNWLRLE